MYVILFNNQKCVRIASPISHVLSIKNSLKHREGDIIPLPSSRIGASKKVAIKKKKPAKKKVKKEVKQKEKPATKKELKKDEMEELLCKCGSHIYKLYGDLYDSHKENEFLKIFDYEKVDSIDNGKVVIKDNHPIKKIKLICKKCGLTIKGHMRLSVIEDLFRVQNDG
jgi:hypothetical protein